MKFDVRISIIILFVGTVYGQNLVKNHHFELDADNDKIPDSWRAAGDSQYVKQTLSLDKGLKSPHSAKLLCKRFQAINAACHAMLSQMGIPVQRGQWYRVKLWARAEGIQNDIVSIALSDTDTWSNCGLQSSFYPESEWAEFEFLFQATRDCAAQSRLQIWYNSTGILWVDNIEFYKTKPNLRRPGKVILPGISRNLIPNASFECGRSGWGSAQWDRTTHWGGKMNRLFGEVDTQEAYHGKCCLRIGLSERTQPISYFDYYDLHRVPIRAPLAANVGWLEVEPGKDYTFSVYLKAAQVDTPAVLAVRQFEGRSFEKSVRVGRDWQRYSMPFRPGSRWCYVLAGPDLRETKAHPKPPKQAVLWLDAIQLERSKEVTRYVPRGTLELGVETDKIGNVFRWGAPVKFWLWARNGDNTYRKTSITLQMTDFGDREVWGRELDLGVEGDGRVVRESEGRSVREGEGRVVREGEGRVVREIVVAGSEELKGFLRLRAVMRVGDETVERTLRLAVVPESQGKDSRFGMNHAYPWGHLLDLNRKAGLTWVRDWSLKWQEVEPAKGKFNFLETDYQIDRSREHGLEVLGLLPFPSSEWASSMPESQRTGNRYEQRRAVVARAPREMRDFERYVERTVAHYKGRIEWFQVFNEPLFTFYALPRKHGYDGGTYATYVKAFARAAKRGNPDCQILAGIGGLREGQIMEDFRQFFAAGGLEVIDAVDIHDYPRIRPPEFVEGLLEKLNGLMDEHGGRKPLWLTEYGYYADDEPSIVPLGHSGFNQPLRDEKQQAAYAVRWNVMMLANGVDKIFYHAGTCAGINQDSLQGVFYEYAGEPHKIYAAQAVMSHLFRPSCRFVKKLSLGKNIKGYLFQDDKRLIAVVWAMRGEKGKAIRINNNKIKLWDIMGRERKNKEFVPEGMPVYLVGSDMTAQEFEGGVDFVNVK